MARTAGNVLYPDLYSDVTAIKQSLSQMLRFDLIRIHELADRGQNSLIDVVLRFARSLKSTFR